ncbi:hypothetical protein [Carnobacterium divergens]|uniref:hypothetical protein n=1 Tax=Carnobacterium divergens TaxID=2748 RepID=UPI0028922420|nr:hypothetical protein [Carnobacterium divergens]MDT2012597.1 hypothetical protein [Carnobacterium divergens]
MINKILENDFFQMLDTSIMSALIGAVITISGIWFTIRHERITRQIERKNTIKPALSIRFIGVSDVLKENYKKDLGNIAKNIYGYSFSPILETFASYGNGSIVGYFPKIGRITPFCRKTGLLFEVHVDGSYPVTDIKVTKIQVTEESDENYIDADRIISIGGSFKPTDSIFDFYHKHTPANFERLSNLGIPVSIVDTSMYNKYISPNNNMVIEVPMIIGMTRLSNLIHLIKNDEEFSKKENFLDVNYSFNDPHNLYRFLTNLNSFPIQITITFQYSDIDDNTYKQSIQCFAYFEIEKIDNFNDFMITSNITTMGYNRYSMDSRVLEDFITEKFLDE